MKKLLALSVLVLVGVSISAASAFAFGECAGKKSHGPTKKITETAPPATTAG